MTPSEVFRNAARILERQPMNKPNGCCWAIWSVLNNPETDTRLRLSCQNMMDRLFGINARKTSPGFRLFWGKNFADYPETAETPAQEHHRLKLIRQGRLLMLGFLAEIARGMSTQDVIDAYYPE